MDFFALSKCTDREVARQRSELFKDFMEIVMSMKVAVRAYAVIRPEEYYRLSSRMSVTECEEIMREPHMSITKCEETMREPNFWRDRV